MKVYRINANVTPQKDIVQFILRQVYKSYADGMEFIITVENGKACFVSANTVGAR